MNYRVNKLNYNRLVNFFFKNAMWSKIYICAGLSRKFFSILYTFYARFPCDVFDRIETNGTKCVILQTNITWNDTRSPCWSEDYPWWCIFKTTIAMFVWCCYPRKKVWWRNVSPSKRCCGWMPTKAVNWPGNSKCCAFPASCLAPMVMNISEAMKRFIWANRKTRSHHLSFDLWRGIAGMAFQWSNVSFRGKITSDSKIFNFIQHLLNYFKLFVYYINFCFNFDLKLINISQNGLKNIKPFVPWTRKSQSIVLRAAGSCRFEASSARAATPVWKAFFLCPCLLAWAKTTSTSS